MCSRDQFLFQGARTILSHTEISIKPKFVVRHDTKMAVVVKPSEKKKKKKMVVLHYQYIEVITQKKKGQTTSIGTLEMD